MFFNTYLSTVLLCLTLIQASTTKYPVFKTSLSNKAILNHLSRLSYFFEKPKYLRSSRNIKDFVFAEAIKDWDRLHEGYMKPLSQLRFDEILGLLSKLSQPLRVGPVPYADRSGELNDKLAPGTHHSSGSSEDEEKKPKKPYPHYSWYDFWTYKKKYITSECPNETVRVDGVCIQTPPH